jgi:Zn-dependent protease/CBS domain-containing protein
VILIAWLTIAIWQTQGSVAALGGLALFLSLFLCVLLHEFGHVAAARYFGIRTPQITLLPIGGIAELEKIPKDPLKELVIAIAGPCVNVVIVGVLWAVTRVAPDWQLTLTPAESVPLLESVMRINVMLAVFNLIPAFPMDGGRVLRALLAYRMPWNEATRRAASIGKMLAFVGGFVALFYVHNVILLLVAMFIFFAASAEASMVETEVLLGKVTAAQAATSSFTTLQAGQRIRDAVELLLAGAQHDFPVVGSEGVCIGILTRAHMIRALSEFGDDSLVGDAMETDIPQFSSEVPVTDALMKLTSMRLTAAPVNDPGGRMTHWLTTDNISEVILTKAAMAKA